MDEGERAKYARDLNCLVDEDRNKRRVALTTFSRLVPSLPPPFLLSDLLPPVLRAFSDPVEKNRELAVGLVAEVCSRHRGLVPGVARAALPVLGARIGSFPFPETTEEIRLLLVQLLGTCLGHPECAAVVRDSLPAVVEVLVRVSGDAFHDVKVSRGTRRAELWLAVMSPRRLELGHGTVR